jgi:hypothetical protein
MTTRMELARRTYNRRRTPVVKSRNGPRAGERLISPLVQLGVKQLLGSRNGSVEPLELVPHWRLAGMTANCWTPAWEGCQ